MKRREGLLKRVISIYANYKTEVVVMLSLIFLGQGLGLLFPYLFGRMTNSIIKLDNIWNSISLAIVCFALIGVLHLIGYFRSIYNMKHLIFPVRQFVRMQAVDRYLNFSIGQIRNHHSGVSKDVMASGEESLVNLARLAVMNFIPVIAKVAVTLVVLLWLYFQLGLITLGGILVYTLLMWKIRKKYIPLIDKARDMVIETGRHKSEVLSGAPIIISHVKESFMLDAHLKKNIKSNEAAIDSNMFVNKYNNIFSYFLRSIEWIVVIVAIYMVYHKTITFGDLITARMWCGELTGSIDTLGDLYQNALENISQVKRFFTLIDIPPSIKEIDNPIQIDSVVGSIEFKRVSYAYPMNELDKKRNKLVIRDVSFYVNPGEKIAFVGPSSAGKSTLINLMVRADDPEAGAILIDGNNLKSLSLSGIRKHIAVVDQSAPMFDDTLRSNILFGANEVMTDEDLARVCNLAEITFVDKLSHGLDTVIGQNGIKLSGGERQRVAIARALARNPKILILDEATSALDTINEVKIKRALDVASRERTTIIIAHRLSTVLDADRIFVMDNGAIVAVGTHNELLIESPLYQDLVENQMVKI